MLQDHGPFPGYVYARTRQCCELVCRQPSELDRAGQKVALQQTTEYPWEGTVRSRWSQNRKLSSLVYIRIPGWCQGVSRTPICIGVRVGRKPALSRCRSTASQSRICGPAAMPAARMWRRGDMVDVTMDMPVRRVKAIPRWRPPGSGGLDARPARVRLGNGQQRGPAPNGVFLPPRRPSRPSSVRTCWAESASSKEVSRHTSPETRKPSRGLEAIPYFGYGNRGNGDLRVWIPETP